MSLLKFIKNINKYVSVYHMVKNKGAKALKIKNIYYQNAKQSINGFALSAIPNAFLVRNQNDSSDKKSYLIQNEIVDQRDVETNIAHLLVLAKLALDKGEIEKAENIINMAITISEKKNTVSALPVLYEALAAIAFSEGNSAKAELVTVTAMEKLIQAGFKENDNSVIDLKLRLARLHSLNGKLDLATVGYNSCIKAQKEKIAAGDLSQKTGILYISSMFWYGVHNIKTKNYRQAQNLVESAYEFSHRIKGISSLQEMTILETLSDLYYEMGLYQRSLQTMIQAVALGMSVKSFTLPECYTKLGNIYAKLDQNELARTSYKKAKHYAKMFDNVPVFLEAEKRLSSVGGESEITQKGWTDYIKGMFTI